MSEPVITMTRDNFKALVSAVADEIQICAAVKAAQAVPAINDPDTEDTDQAHELIKIAEVACQLAHLTLDN